jgi:hypothetical protein
VEGSVFWDITPCSLVKIRKTFRKKMSLPSSVSKSKQSKEKQHKARIKQSQLGEDRTATNTP